MTQPDHRVPPQPARPGERDGLTLLAVALIIVLLLHGTLLFNQSFVRTYDALIHIFFASHYAQDWFDPWEPRWYTGFWLVSYPPLAHYLIALTSKLVGLKVAFAVVQLAALFLLTVGVYRFARLIVPARAAGYAAIALALSSSISETVHVFGQLPTTLSLGFLLNAIPFGWAFVQGGGGWVLLRAVLWMAATTAAHHVTTLFGSVFFTAPTLLIAVLAGVHWRTLPRTRARWWLAFRQAMPRLLRAVLFAVLTVLMLVIVVLPYWLWSRADPIEQVPIPHASRENFLENANAALIFWVIPWASTLLFLPYAWSKLFTWRWPVIASLTLLFVLGTGGTTPIPRALLRGAFDILTLDRFTFWATILILPFVGLAITSARSGPLRAWLSAIFTPRGRDVALAALLLGTSTLAIAVSTLTRYRKFQPEAIDPAPIVSFLEKDQHWRYRYLTLGFGDQLAWLSANTRASTPDGNYHSARRLPELTSTPIERLEGAKFSGTEGIESLRRFLTYPEKYNLKFVFSNDAFYDPLLYFSGWHRLGTLENGVQLWEREDIPPLPERLPRPELPAYQVAMWGILPLAAPLLAFLSLALPAGRGRARQGEPEAPGAGGAGGDSEVVPPSPHVVRNVRVALVVLTGGAAVAVAYVAWREYSVTRGPAHAVVRYWDAVDFRRFSEAYGRIYPVNDLSEERWLLDLSVQGGLRTGYAKLASIEVLDVEYAGNPRGLGARAAVRVQLEWFTALGDFTDVVVHDLRLTRDGWRIVTAPRLQVRPPKRFAAQPGLDHYVFPRRLSEVEAPVDDILDRPRLVIPEARLVNYLVDAEDGEAERQLAIIGVIQNVDARPADLTVTGVLRGEGGQEVARNNAETRVIHKLLPGEATPFVVAFDAVETTLDPDSVTSASVDARAVVTGRDLGRTLGAWTDVTADGVALRLVNHGTVEATIPHALLGVFDEGGLAWVHHDYLPQALVPGERARLKLPAALPAGYEVLEADVERSVEGLQVPEGEASDVITFPLGDGARYRVWLHAFHREEP